MANDPNQPLGDRERIARETGARVGYGWIWIWIVIIVILVIWFGGFGWGGYGGWWWGSRTHTAVVPHEETGGIGNAQPAPAGNAAALGGSGVQILTAANKQPFVNQAFNIRNVPIQQTNSNRAFWIGANSNDTMLIVLTGNQDSAANANLQQGQRVNVTGTVARAPSAENARRMWSLSDDDTQRLEQQGVYVQATQVQTEQPQQTQQP